MNEADEDFAAMFEASVGAKRFERGQTVDGTIVEVNLQADTLNMVEIEKGGLPVWTARGLPCPSIGSNPRFSLSMI